LDFVFRELCVYVTEVVLVTPVGKAVILVVGVCKRLVDTLNVTLCVLTLVCEDDTQLVGVLELVVLDVRVLVCFKLWVSPIDLVIVVFADFVFVEIGEAVNVTEDVDVLELLDEPVFVGEWELVFEGFELLVPDDDDVQILDVVDEKV
jgi:hypothetical protein